MVQSLYTYFGRQGKEKNDLDIHAIGKRMIMIRKEIEGSARGRKGRGMEGRLKMQMRNWQVCKFTYRNAGFRDESVSQLVCLTSTSPTYLQIETTG